MKISRENRVIKKSPHLARKKRRLEIAKKIVVITVAILVILGSALYWLYRPEANINKVEVKGTVVLKPSLVEEVVNGEISGKYFYLVPKRSAFFYPKDSILRKLEESFKRIEKASVERSGLTGLTVTISERPERYLWCGRALLLERTPENICYFADSGGYVFSRAPFYSGYMFLEFYGPISAEDVVIPVGKVVLPEDKFNKVVAFRNGLIPLGFNATKILIKIDGDYELFMAEGGRILLSSKNDLEKSLKYLNLALGADPLKAKIEKNREMLDYLDLRFGNKVFFRFK